MNPESKLNEDALANATRDEIMSAIFADMVIHLGNTALIFLGRIPNPETGQPMLEIEGAKMLIDQLEMLQEKTKGNLSKEEQQLLLQTLSTLQLAFVEAINSQVSDEIPAQPTSPVIVSPTPPSADDSPGKRFSKKY